MNLKIGEGYATYTYEDHYKTTYAFAKKGYETFILYYDCDTDLVQIFDKKRILAKERISVGHHSPKHPLIPLTQALKQIASRLTPFSPGHVFKEKTKQKNKQEKQRIN